MSRHAAFLLAALTLAGCAPAPPTNSLASYERALAARETAGVASGSEAEVQAVARFIEFYRDFTTEPVRRQIRTVYADHAWFRDPFEEVEGIDAVEAYFLDSTETIAACSFDIREWAEREGNYYFRWIMTLHLRRDADGPPIRAVGMSHVRFDRDGKVLFHQDYWDAAGTVYERLPVIGWILRWIRSRI